MPKRYFPVVNFSKKDHFKGKHEKDRIPKDYVLIFNNASGTSVRIAVIIVNCSIIGLGLALYFLTPEGLKWREDKGGLFLSAYILFCLAAVYFFIVLIYRGTMLRIYKNLDTNVFIGVVPRWILSTKKFAFSVQDIKRKESVFKILRLFRGDVQIKNKPFLLSTYDFSLPKYFNEIHRYDSNIQNKRNKMKKHWR